MANEACSTAAEKAGSAASTPCLGREKGGVFGWLIGGFSNSFLRFSKVLKFFFRFSKVFFFLFSRVFLVLDGDFSGFSKVFWWFSMQGSGFGCFFKGF